MRRDLGARSETMSSTMEAPIACTLGSEDLRARLERIANLGRRATSAAHEKTGYTSI